MKRIVSALMSVLLVFSCIGVSVAASFPDIETDWAINEIEYMVSKGILNGYPEDGTFKPTQTVTRAEFIKMMCETFGLTATTAINYSDVKTGDWFYPYIQKAAAQGFLLNYGSALNPNGQLSRQEAAALLVRYLDLDPANAAPSSTYADYAKIKTAYREYVLQATAEGLFQGRENGNFDPDATLQRREAAAILHRAVGTIYRSSQEGTDLTAAVGNAIITTSGVTVHDANIADRLIITEGASGGKIVLEDCEIGELIIRGTATLELDGTDVDSIIVDSAVSGATTYIIMGNGLDIGKVQLKTPGRMEIKSRTVIDELVVEKDAKNSSATGYGTVNALTVQAAGFEADAVPYTYDIASGITAQFNKLKYSGSSASAATTGFTQAPSTYASASSCFLTSTSVSGGKLYYYYSFNATAPNKTTFDSYYEAAAVKGNYTVTKSALDQNTGATITVAAYPYVVVMLRDEYNNAYTPIVITNRSSSGFTVAPEVTTSNSYHYLAYTAGESGTLYYYYTNNSEVPTASNFNYTYNASSTSYKGTVDVTKSVAANSILLSTARVTNYAYIAVMLEDMGGEYYQPVLVPVKDTASALGNGFSSTPKCSLVTDGISMSFTAANAGTLQYYFTTNSADITNAQFDTNLALTDAALTGAATVSAGSSASLKVGNKTSASSYPYIVVRLTSGTTRYNPVVVPTSGIAVDLTNTGFTATPVVTVENGYYYITPNTSYSARVYYYLTDSTSVANSEVFIRNYENSVSAYLANKTGGYVTTSSFSSLALQTNLVASTQISYKYMALMVSLNGQNYKPVVVPLAAVDITHISATDLFLSGPMYTIFTATHQVDFTAKKNGRIFYTYVNSKDEAIDTESLIANALFGDNSDETTGHQKVTANLADHIVLSAPTGEYPAYFAVVFQDDAGNVYTPVYLKTDGTAGYSIASTGFISTPVVTAATSATGYPTITYGTMEFGTIYYYFTNSNTGIPSSASAFMSMYNSTALESLRGTITTSIGNDTQTLYTLGRASSYPYVVLMFQSADGGTGGFYRPTYLQVGGGSGSSSYMQNAFSSTPYLSNNYLYYTPSVTGMLYYSYSDTNAITDWMEKLKIGAVAGLSSYSELSNLLVSIENGGKTTVTSAGSLRSLPVTVDTYQKYMVVWMVTAAGTLTAPEFILTSGNIAGLPGTGTGSTSVSSYGFSLDPFLFESTIACQVPYAGTVRFLFTSSTESNVTNNLFEMMYTIYSNTDPIMVADPSNFVFFEIPTPSEKYVWIQYTSAYGTAYTPYVLQLW